MPTRWRPSPTARWRPWPWRWSGRVGSPEAAEAASEALEPQPAASADGRTPRTRRLTTRTWRPTAEDEDAEEPAAPEPVEEDDFDEDTLSLSALENKLRDGVLETFDRIAEAYLGLRELQEERLTLIQARRPVSRRARPRATRAPAQGMVELMQQVSLNSSRVEALVQQLFDMNKHAAEPRGQAAAHGGRLPGARARASSSTIWATSSTTTGWTGWRG